MQNLRNFFAATLFAALTAAAVCTCVLIRTATHAVRQVPIEMEAARADLNRQLTATRRDLLVRADRQASAIRTDTLAEVDRIRETADRRIGDTLARADLALQTVTTLQTDLKPTLDRSAAIAAQVDDALPLFLDCDHNPDCVFNRYVGASKSFEKASQNFAQTSVDFRGAVPAMLSTWQSIGTNVAGTAANINRLTKPHWYDRLIGYGLNGALVYRNFRP